jgi:hypothetical protein
VPLTRFTIQASVSSYSALPVALANYVDRGQDGTVDRGDQNQDVQKDS